MEVLERGPDPGAVFLSLPLSNSFVSSSVFTVQGLSSRRLSPPPPPPAFPYQWPLVFLSHTSPPPHKPPLVRGKLSFIDA